MVVGLRKLLLGFCSDITLEFSNISFRWNSLVSIRVLCWTLYYVQCVMWMHEYILRRVGGRSLLVIFLWLHERSGWEQYAHHKLYHFFSGSDFYSRYLSNLGDYQRPATNEANYKFEWSVRRWRLVIDNVMTTVNNFHNNFLLGKHKLATFENISHRYSLL